MEGTTEEGRLEGALEGWVGQFCRAEWGAGVACSQVQRPESSWPPGVGSVGEEGRVGSSQRPRNLVGSQSSLGLFREAGLDQKQAVCWEPTLCRLWAAPLTR